MGSTERTPRLRQVILEWIPSVAEAVWECYGSWILVACLTAGAFYHWICVEVWRHRLEDVQERNQLLTQRLDTYKSLAREDE